MSFQDAYETFKAQDAEDAIVKATECDWGGEEYKVELFEDGTYRCLYGSEIGNLYESPGIIIGVPALSDDEYNSEDPALSIFDGALEGLDEAFAEKMERIDIPSKPDMIARRCRKDVMMTEDTQRFDLFEESRISYLVWANTSDPENLERAYADTVQWQHLFENDHGDQILLARVPASYAGTFETLLDSDSEVVQYEC